LLLLRCGFPLRGLYRRSPSAEEAGGEGDKRQELGTGTSVRTGIAPRSTPAPNFGASPNACTPPRESVTQYPRPVDVAVTEVAELNQAMRPTAEP
jgi:hypothetical protein